MSLTKNTSNCLFVNVISNFYWNSTIREHSALREAINHQHTWRRKTQWKNMGNSHKGNDIAGCLLTEKKLVVTRSEIWAYCSWEVLKETTGHCKIYHRQATLQWSLVWIYINKDFLDPLTLSSMPWRPSWSLHKISVVKFADGNICP